MSRCVAVLPSAASFEDSAIDDLGYVFFFVLCINFVKKEFILITLTRISIFFVLFQEILSAIKRQGLPPTLGIYSNSCNLSTAMLI